MLKSTSPSVSDQISILGGLVTWFHGSLTDLFLTHVADSFHKGTLVFELVTLNAVVKWVILRRSKFFAGTIIAAFVVSTFVAQQTTLSSDTFNPECFSWHTCVTSTVTLTITSVTALRLSFSMSSEAVTWNVVIITLTDITFLNKVTYLAANLIWWFNLWLYISESLGWIVVNIETDLITSTL